MWSAKATRLIVDSTVLLLFGAMFAGWLLRVAPGASVDEREADPRFTAATMDRLKAQRDSARAGATLSLSWVAAVLHGDLGVSETTGEAVNAMLAERTPLTLRTVLIGAAGGLIAGIAAAGLSTFLDSSVLRLFTTGASLGILTIPSGLLALFAVFLTVPVEAAVAIAVWPKTCLYAQELFADRARSAWMLSANAAGVPALRVFFRHLLPSVSRELGAVAGLAVVGALAVTIPAEVLTGRPGLGQLAWRSAMDRDLPVVIAVTLVMVIIARSVTLLSAVPEKDAGTLA